MKLEDIIDFSHSFWNALGQTGGTALPDNDKSVKVNDVDVWKKDPPFRKKNNKRTDEAFGGRGGGQQSITPHYDISQHPDIDKIGGVAEPSMDEPEEFDNWATPPKEGKSFIVKDRNGRTRKIMIRRSGENSAMAMDDEGNHYLLPHTGKIDHKRMHTGMRSRYQSVGELPERANTGTGLGGTGATMHPVSGPAELEYDLDYVEDEFKGKDTRADIKTNKKKRMNLKKYLMRRTRRE